MRTYPLQKRQLKGRLSSVNMVRPYVPFDPVAAWERVEERLKRMTDDEKIQTLVRAGLLTEDLEIAEPYRSAPPEKSSKKKS